MDGWRDDSQEKIYDKPLQQFLTTSNANLIWINVKIITLFESFFTIRIIKIILELGGYWYEHWSFVAGDSKSIEASESGQMNMKGVYLHILGDALGSVIVIVAALIIKYVDGEWTLYVDPGMR